MEEENEAKKNREPKTPNSETQRKVKRRKMIKNKSRKNRVMKAKEKIEGRRERPSRLDSRRGKYRRMK